MRDCDALVDLGQLGHVRACNIAYHHTRASIDLVLRLRLGLSAQLHVALAALAQEALGPLSAEQVAHALLVELEEADFDHRFRGIWRALSVVRFDPLTQIAREEVVHALLLAVAEYGVCFAGTRVPIRKSADGRSAEHIVDQRRHASAVRRRVIVRGQQHLFEASEHVGLLLSLAHALEPLWYPLGALWRIDGVRIVLAFVGFVIGGFRRFDAQFESIAFEPFDAVLDALVPVLHFLADQRSDAHEHRDGVSILFFRVAVVFQSDGLLRFADARVFGTPVDRRNL